MSGYVTHTCSDKERADALSLLYQQMPPADRERQVESLLEADRLGTGHIRFDGLLVCHHDDRLVGTMLCMASPGRVMMAWPPRAAESLLGDHNLETYRSLLRGSIDLARTARSRFIQLLGDTPAPPLDVALAECGFGHLTQLVYARRPVKQKESLAPCPDELQLVPYTDSLRAELGHVLLQSYEHSLDCPELSGLRSMDDIIDSHHGGRRNGTDHWYLAKAGGDWVGCLLLADAGFDRLLEISYVAVLPSARGHQYGRALTREAIRQASEGGFEAVILAVDGRNVPALGMYEDEGFYPWDIREIYLCVLDPHDRRSASAEKSL